VAIFDTYLQLALQGTQHYAPTVETEMILRLHESLQAKFAVSGKDIPGNVNQTL
jgi:hypothetical protein